ncbi:MAG: VOC family protein [Anaerolineae bacterium]|nr:VOC family protein [Anaerolineae bacterium]
MNKPKTGMIVWQDLTVDNAEEIKDFYSRVVGWQTTAQPMGDYDDFNISAPDDEAVIAGICHARESNANLPPQWLIYIAVDDVAASAQRCVELGGKIIDGPRLMGESNFCVIQDPAGAVVALID